MKKILFLSLFITIILASCDYVDTPYPQTNVNLSDTSTCFTPVFPAVTSHIKKILIEDYTGHTCGNCPRAATELHEIDSIYPGRIVGLAVHVGSTFAAPAPGYAGSPSTAFLADYRTPAGDDYDATFGAANFGLPQGMFNRKEFDPIAQTHLKFFPNWKTYAASIISEPSVVDLQIISEYNSTSRKICCFVKDSFLTTMTDTLKLAIVLTQDSIIDWQDYIGVLKSDYVHRHMLRDAITPSGAWGESLVTGTIAAGTKHINKYAYNIPETYNGIPCDVNHCHLVAFIYKARTKEILQVEEVELIP